MSGDGWCCWSWVLWILWVDVVGMRDDEQWRLHDFPKGGANFVRGAPTPNAVTFRKILYVNSTLRGARACGAPGSANDESQGGGSMAGDR